MAKVSPPVEHQFRKGNKGKPKGAINVKTRMIKALLKKAEYPDLSQPKNDKGRFPKATGQVIDYVISSLIKKALKGNIKAFEILLDRAGETVNRQQHEDEEFKPIEKVRIQIIDCDGGIKNIN